MEGCPKDLLYSILQLCGYKSICRASQVCHLWNDHLSADKPIWDYLCWTLRITPNFLQLSPTESRKTIWTTFHKIFRSSSSDFPKFLSRFQELKSSGEKHVGYLSCYWKQQLSRPFEVAKKWKEGWKKAKQRCPRDLMCWFLICDQLCFSGTDFLVDGYYLDMGPTDTYFGNFDALRICYFDLKYHYYVLNPVGKKLGKFKKGNVVWKNDIDVFFLVAETFEEFLGVILNSLKGLSKSYMPYDKIKKTLQDIYYRIAHEVNISKGDLEIINIEYDRMAEHFDRIQEALKDQEEFNLKWRSENEVVNKEAFEGVLKNLKEMNEEQLVATLEIKPYLKLLLLSSQEMNQFAFESMNTYNTTNYSLIEKRAIYFKMGELEKEKEIVKSKMVELMEIISSSVVYYEEKQQMEAKLKTPTERKPVLLPTTTHSKEEFLSEILSKRKKQSKDYDNDNLN